MDTATVAAIRFGYGLRPRPQPATREAVLDSLRGPDVTKEAYPLWDAETARAALRRQRKLRQKLRKGDESVRDEAMKLRRSIIANPSRVLRAAFARIADSDAPLRERLTAFWMDHFSVSARNDGPRAMVGDFIDIAIRPHLTSRFSDMLRAVVQHPAMLMYLDQAVSMGPNSRKGLSQGRGLNENLAREVLELHTLGVASGYGQRDVRQFAELLTGLTFHPNHGVRFLPAWAEPGSEEVLARTYGGSRNARIEDILTFLDDLSVHPDTARHVSRKLAVHFVSDAPPDVLVDAMAAAWIDTDGDLMAVYGAMLDAPAAWVPVGAKAKQPFDFIASSLAALGITGPAIMAWKPKTLNQVTDRPMRLMGQRFLQPDGPDGWPEEAAVWITPLGLAQRISWGQRMPKRLLQATLPDPRQFVDQALGDAAGARLRWAVSASETVPQGIGLIFASPEFNRR